MNKRTRGFILVTLAIALGAWVTAQSPSFPGIQGFYSAGKKWIGVAVDSTGKLNVNASFTPTGTQDVNLKQVGGNTVVTGGVNGSQGVGGLAAEAAALAGNPNRIGISDATNIRTPLTASAVGDANAATAIPSFAPSLWQGTAWDRQFYCNTQAAVTISAGTDTVLVTGVASTFTRVCHLDFGSDTSVTATIRQGTGSNCGTNTLALTGSYPNTLTLAEDYQPTAPLKTTILARDLCLHLSTSATVGGFVVYETGP